MWDVGHLREKNMGGTRGRASGRGERHYSKAYPSRGERGVGTYLRPVGKELVVRWFGKLIRIALDQSGQTNEFCEFGRRTCLVLKAPDQQASGDAQSQVPDPPRPRQRRRFGRRNSCRGSRWRGGSPFRCGLQLMLLLLLLLLQ